MKTPTKFKTEKNKRYYLHKRLKVETSARLDAHKRAIYVEDESQITQAAAKLRDEYGYSIQMEIPQ